MIRDTSKRDLESVVQEVEQQESAEVTTLPEKVKVTFLISRSDLDILKGIASEDGVTVTETLRRAIRTEAFLRQEAAKGYKLFLGNEKGTIKKEIVRWGF